MLRNLDPGVLHGVRSICRYTRVSPRTFYRWHYKYGFPAIRLPDGRWSTTKSLIDAWYIRRMDPLTKQRWWEMLRGPDAFDSDEPEKMKP